MADSAQPSGGQPDPRRIVLVIGPGRSGTSTIAGALAKSGFEVPGKAIQANETNPSGFFEPRWVVDFHKELLDRTGVNTLDSAPAAYERVTELVLKDQHRDRLRTWLAGRLESQPRLVVKDPRTVWFRELWVETARELGVEPGFITMLRHPAEVSASREKYYAKSAGESRRGDDVARIAGWVNVALTSERITQGSPRAFVRYTDLVADWRRVLTRVGSTLDLTFDPGPETSPHPVDDFIDPSLHRVQVDWDDVAIPVALRDLGERTWTGLTRLADEGESAAVVADLEGVRAEYHQLTEDAFALNRHAIRRLEAEARRKGRRQATKEAKEAQESAAAAAVPEPAEPAASGPLGVWRKLRGGTP